jgi:hypothetical protein|tara:strand:- start:817 stop:939 length:123 start_codon:yes stop_codon:yes gene_type:complete
MVSGLRAMEETELSQPAFLHVHIIGAFVSASILMLVMLVG